MMASADPGDAPGPNSDRVALGRFLFHDRRLSRDRKAACSNCHTLSKFGVDGKPAGVVVGESRGTGSVPSLFNTAMHVALSWVVPAPHVEANAAGPSVSPTEMATRNERSLVDALGRVPRYVEMFGKAFPNEARPISLKNVGEAIEAFERGLVSNSRWDKFSAGDVSALTLEEKHGLRAFIKSGCVACHTGPSLGGTMYQKVGVAYPWPNPKDQERSAGTNSVAARMVLQVPSLKNIAETAPYFHDGATSNLQAAIRLMAHHQLGIELSNEDVDAIAAWMRSLTGDIAPDYIAVPELPPEG